MPKQKIQYIYVTVKKIIMTHEEKLKDFLDRALKYMEKGNVSSDTAKKYRAAASHNLLCVIQSLTKEDILEKLGDERTRDRETAAGLLEEFIESQKHIQPITSETLERVQSLVGDMNIDLDAPLSDEDE